MIKLLLLTIAENDVPKPVLAILFLECLHIYVSEIDESQQNNSIS